MQQRTIAYSILRCLKAIGRVLSQGILPILFFVSCGKIMGIRERCCA
jgi:hypothetical protein